MEENHFESTDNTINSKTDKTKSTTEFLDSERKKVQEHESDRDVRTETPETPDSETVVIDVQEYQNISPGSDCDIEDNLNDVALDQKEPEINMDDLPETVTLLTTKEGGKCYLIGTAHFSIESQNDVSKVIQAVRPHVVMVELCLDRIHVLQLDEETILEEAKNLDYSKAMDVIKKNGVHKGLFYILLLNMSANITKVLGLAPGGEFRRALKEAKKIYNCVIHMGDRPIKITFARALAALTWWQTLKLTWNLLTETGPITQSEVEKYKAKDALEKMMEELGGEYPVIKKVFVEERDTYLTYSLQLACRTRIHPNGVKEPTRVVGVVGAGHTLGIVEKWGKVTADDIPLIMSIPPPSLTSKVLKFTLKASVVGGVIFVGYKFILIPTGIANSMQNILKKCVSFVPMLLSE
ncbi:hypothetical protein TKK_0002470 [Trichogramma kaykai]|uniref:TraB domain-containing protein n=1 Tax=Trichogramma kaykai TaxID=54128 RepID=A0ABD2VXB1_9HYME